MAYSPKLLGIFEKLNELRLNEIPIIFGRYLTLDLKPTGGIELVGFAE